METLDKIHDRQRQQMGDFLQSQVSSWKDLIVQYDNDPNKIPPEVYQQWQAQYGVLRREGILAQHAAELKAYSINPSTGSNQPTVSSEDNKKHQPRWMQSLRDREPDSVDKEKENEKDKDKEEGFEPSED